MSNSEFPSANKLESLRERGVVPYSSFTARCMSLLGVGLCAFVVFDGFRALGSQWKQIGLASDLDLALRSNAELFTNRLTKLLLAPCIAALLFFVLSGLLQTRFMFRFAALAPDIGRLWSWQRFGLRAIAQRFAVALLLVCLALLLGLCLAYFLLFDVLSLLNYEHRHLIDWAQSYGRSFAPVFFSVLVVAALISWLTQRYWFLWRHSMSSEEQRREATRE